MEVVQSEVNVVIGEIGRDRRGRGEETVYSTFMLNVGREDGLTPRDLMGLINKYSRRRGDWCRRYSYFDTDTKFEIDEESASDFAVDFSKVLFNGIPLEIKAILTRDNGRRRDDRSRGGFPEDGNVVIGTNEIAEVADVGKKRVVEREEEDREVIRKSREISIDRLPRLENNLYI